MLGKCGYYAVVLAYVADSYPFVRALRRLQAAGARLDFVDEAERRIVAAIPLSRLGEVAALEGEGALSSVAVEVKASCRLSAPARALARALASAGFKPGPRGGGRALYYGLHAGRAVEVEVAEGRVKVKVGARASAPPSPPVPPGIFALPPGEAAEAAEALRGLVSELRRMRVEG